MSSPDYNYSIFKHMYSLVSAKKENCKDVICTEVLGHWIAVLMIK